MPWKDNALAASCCFCLIFLCACSPGIRTSCRNTVCGPDVKIIDFHVKEDQRLIKMLIERLYAKNPRYEPDLKKRGQKIRSIFQDESEPMFPDVQVLPSHRILQMAFSESPPIPDRVFLLGLGLKKGIDEAYAVNGAFLTGCQIDIGRLQRLYNNISQANWRMKTYRDPNGNLLFLTNEATDNGYINMGFEVLMTKILTRIEDDIYLRGGLVKNFVFRMGTIFLSII